MPGAYHIHTSLSDGAEQKAAVAAAAARAGLKFAIFTDHGDGTRRPDAPAYIAGVLCIDGVEVSTNEGHYVALDMPAAPYPLGGEAAAVVEDVARLGGFGIAAHVDSAKPELAWRDWRAPIDGVEWLNVDSEWRDESSPRLLRAILEYGVRPAPAIAAILDRPSATLDRWAELSRTRRVVALAALDAHGGVRRQIEGSRRFPVGPSYEASFRTLSNRVILQAPLSGRPVADARAVLDAIRAGRVFTSIDALAAPAFVNPAAPVASWTVPADARVDAMRAGESGWYEIQVPRAPGRPPIPWVLTNPLMAPAGQPPLPVKPLETGPPITPAWRIEKDALSSGALRATESGAVRVTYELYSGSRLSQFVALAGDLNETAAEEQVVFEGEAGAPMRISVQLRFPGTEGRWVKSTYLDPERRTVIVPVQDMVAAERSAGAMPNPATARSLLFVVDLTNAAPGSRGSFTVNNVRLARRP